MIDWENSGERRRIMIQVIVAFTRGRMVTTGDILRAFPRTRPLIDYLISEDILITAGKRRWKLNPKTLNT